MKKLSLNWLISLVLVTIVFFVGTSLVRATVQEDNWSDWNDTSNCVANECNTSNGTKNQERTLSETVCDKECPTVTFTASHYVYTEDSIQYGAWGNWSSWSSNNKCSSGDEQAGTCEDEKIGNSYRRRYRTVEHICPVGYTYDEQSGPNDCKKLETFTKTFKYNKSQDPNHCHKPTPETLDIPSWARDDYGKLVNELGTENKNCRQEVIDTQTRTVSCENAPVIVCEPEFTPTPISGTPTPQPCIDNCEPTSTPIATETPNGDVCANIDGIQTSVPEGLHLDAGKVNCVSFSVPGPGSSDSGIGGGEVLGTSTGQVLGTSTMAQTGGAMDSIFYSMFTLGSLLTSFGIMKNGKKETKN